MRKLAVISCSFATLLFLPNRGFAQIPVANVQRTEPVDFEREILPLFRKACLACHNATEANGKLVLETPVTILKGGESGPAVVAKNGVASLLLKVAAQQVEPKMPPADNDVGAKPLTSQELGLLKLWIDQGATGVVTAAISPKSWRELPRGVNPIYATAITRDGQFAACGRANQIFIYHVPTGQLVTRLNDAELQQASKAGLPGIAHRDLIQSLAFNEAGDLLASGGFRTVKLWRRPRDVRKLEITAPGVVTAVAASPSQSLLALASDDNIIRLINRKTGQVALTIPGHSATVSELEFLPDGRLASASADKTIRFWNLDDGSLVGRIDTASEVNDISVLPDGSGIVSGHADKFSRYWSVPRSLSVPLEAVAKATTRVVISPDQRFLATGNAVGIVRVVDVDCGQYIDESWQAHQDAITGLSFSADGSRLVTSSVDRTVRIWSFDPDSRSQQAAAVAEGVPTATSWQLESAIFGTLGDVSTTAIRPDGLQVVSGMSDGRVSVWKVVIDEPRELALVGLPKPVATEPKPAATPAATNAAAKTETPPPIKLAPNGSPGTFSVLSPDGKSLATTGTEAGRPVILVRSFETGELLNTLQGHQAAITSIAFASDNQRLVTASTDGSARVWDLRDAKFPETLAFGGHASAVTTAAFTADGTRIVSGSADNTVKLWNATSSELMMDFVGHTDAVLAAAMLPNNQNVISVSADKTIRVWNVADGKVARTVTTAGALSRACFTRDVGRVAVVDADNGVQLYNVADGKLLQTLVGHQTKLAALAFAADGSRLLSADASQVMVWETASGRLLEIIPLAKGLASATFGPTITGVVIARADSGIADHALRFERGLGDHTQAVTAATYLADGSTLFTSSLDGTARRFVVATGQQVFSANHAAAINSLAVSPNSALLATAGADNTVKLWTAANGAAQPNPQLGGFTAPVSSVAFSRDNTRLVAAGTKPGEVFAFDVATRTMEHAFVEHTAAVSALVMFDTGEPTVVSASADGTVRQWPLLQRRRFAGHTGPVTTVAAIPGAIPQMVTGSQDGTLRHWNLQTGQQIRQLAHAAPVTAVAVRPDGQRFASTGENNIARLWNSANGQALAQMKGDIRSLNVVSKLTQELSLATKKVASVQVTLKAAQDMAPVIAATAKTAADALTAANAEVTKQQAALTTANTAKVAAEKTAVESAAAAQQATLTKLRADADIMDLNKTLARARDKAQRAKTALQADTKAPGLIKASQDADKAVVDLQAKLKLATDNAAKAATATTAAATAANTAAAAAVTASRPYTVALTALRAAKVVQNTASQTSALAAAESKRAADAIPTAQAELVAAQARMAKFTAELAAGQKAATAAEQPMRSVAFSSDGRLLATGGDFQTVHTWSTEDGKAVASFKGHAGTIGAVAFVGPSELLSGSADKAAVVWDAEPEWKLETTIGSVTDPGVFADRVKALDFSNDGTLLLAGGGVPSRSGEVKLFNVADGKLIRSWMDAHTDGVLGVAFSPDGSKMVSCGSDRYIKMFDVASGKFIRPFEGHTDYVLDVTWQSDGKSIVSCGADNVIKVWNAESGEQIRTIAGFEKQITCVRFIGESINVVSSSGDNTVRQHRSDNGQQLRIFPGSIDFMYCVDATPDARFVIAGGFDSVLRVWNGANGQAIHALEPPKPAAKEVGH
ncbi:MAG: hypothetical protein O3A00_01440 [Planctomycetota bacterium]|nr:hypothetical protein [Planctomycetota bacterium]